MAHEAFGEPPLKRNKGSNLDDIPQLVSSLFDFMQQEYNSAPDKISKNNIVDFCLTHLHMELDDTELSRALEALDSNADEMFDKDEISEVIKQLRLIRLKFRSFFNGRHDSAHFPREDFDFGRTTQENYKANLDAGVEEMHGREREELRGGFHKQNYSRVRQQWQDGLVQQAALPMAPRCDDDHPWLIYTCGTPGAGKGFVMSWLSDQGFFPLETVVHVDPDTFKLHMPEWPAYKQKGETSVDKVCGDEANFLADLAQEVAMSNGNFVWRDTTLLAADRIKDYMKEVRKRLPKYKIAVFYIFADEETVRKRIQAREAQTGRSVTADFIQFSFDNIKKSLTIVQDEVDIVAMIDNSGKAPQPILSSLLTVDRSHSWGKVGAVFSGSTNPFPEELDAVFLSDVESPPGMSYSERTVSFPGTKQLKTSQPLPLPDSWRSQLPSKIGGAACLAYMHAVGSAYGGEHNFEGGFLFLSADMEPLYVMRIYSTRGKHESIMQFGKAAGLSEPAKEYVKARAHGVFSSSLRRKGAERFMWKGPGEAIDGIGDEGGFAFLCRDGRGFFFPYVGLTTNYCMKLG